MVHEKPYPVLEEKFLVSGALWISDNRPFSGYKLSFKNMSEKKSVENRNTDLVFQGLEL